MKIKNIFAIAAFAAAISLSSCDDQLEIVPKGKTTLDKVEDLELLLSQDWELNNKPANDIETVAGVAISWGKSVPEVLANTNSLERAYLVFDENLNRANYCQDDARYSDIYKWCNYMNIIISKIGDATGNEGAKPRIEAEAKFMRAYFHFLGVNIYAKQYNEATADKDGGIAYLDNTNVEETKAKLTVAEVYDRILDDMSDENIKVLNDYVSNTVRIDKAFGNAAKAKVLFQMKKYTEAIPYCRAALSYNDNMEDRSYIKTDFAWSNSQDSPNNILHISGGMFISPTLTLLSRETKNLFEANDYVKKYGRTDYSELYGELQGGLSGLVYCSGWEINKNGYGIRTETMHYVLGECLIRTGQIREGLAEVDKVRKLHIENPELFAAKFDAEGLNEQQAMKLLQDAKWIECIGEYDTFFDCKRWNSEDKYKRTFTRDLGEHGTFSIGPDSPLWVMPFPQSATRYNPTLTQNY